MDTLAHPITAGDTIAALLEGGPSDIPEALRMSRAHANEVRIKLAFRGGYEHFERVPRESDATTTPVIFRWTTRTKVAE